MQKLNTPYGIDWIGMLKEHGYSVSKASRELGVSYLFKMLTGQSRLDLDVAIHLLDMCGYELVINKKEP